MKMKVREAKGKFSSVFYLFMECVVKMFKSLRQIQIGSISFLTVKFKID